MLRKKVRNAFARCHRWTSPMTLPLAMASRWLIEVKRHVRLNNERLSPLSRRKALKNLLIARSD
jgi:hypothetical protein